MAQETSEQLKKLLEQHDTDAANEPKTPSEWVEFNETRSAIVDRLQSALREEATQGLKKETAAAIDELDRLNDEAKAMGGKNDFAAIAESIPTKETAAAAVAAAETNYFPNMRRLAIRDMANFAKIIGNNLKEIMPVFAPVMNSGAKLTPELLISAVQEQLPHLTGDFMGIVVSVAGLSSADEFMDLPLDALPYFINRLLSENDLTGFLTRAFKLAESYTTKQTNRQAQNGFLSAL